MHNITKNTKILYVFAVVLLLIFIALSVLFMFRFDLGGNRDSDITGEFDRDYSSLNQLTPGESTYEEVIDKNGEPSSVSTTNGETILTYDTPNSGLKNEVVFKNNTLQYSTEYVFSDYRGSYSDFAGRLGEPPLVLYSKELVGIEWAIFLSNGVGVEHSNNEIGKIIYFIPQNKTSFINNFLGVLDASEELPEPHEEEFINLESE